MANTPRGLDYRKKEELAMTETWTIASTSMTRNPPNQERSTLSVATTETGSSTLSVATTETHGSV